MNNLQITIKKESKMDKVKTSKRLHTWTVQKKEGGRWRTIVDSMGVITFATRKFARSVSREYNNIARQKRSFRVRKLT